MRIECPRFNLGRYSTCQHLRKFYTIFRFRRPIMLTGELFRWSFFDCPRLVTQFTFLPYMNAKTACFECMGCQHAPHLSRGNTQSATMPLTFPRHHLRCRNHNALTMIRLPTTLNLEFVDPVTQLPPIGDFPAHCIPVNL